MTDQSAPKPKTLWRHRNGNIYAVLLITNLPDEERYPRTVVYQNILCGSVWSRRADDWHRSFTPAPELTIDQLEGLCARLERELKEAEGYEASWRTCAIFSDPAPTNSWDWRDRQRRRISEIRGMIHRLEVIERRGG